MKNLLILSFFISTAQAGGPLLDIFRPMDPTFTLKTSFQETLSEQEQLEEKRDRRISWTEEDANRLAQLKKDSLLKLYNIFQRMLAKAGLSDGGGSVEVSEKMSSNSSPVVNPISAATEVFENSPGTVNNDPAYITLPGSGNGGGSGNPPSGSVVVHSPNDFVPTTKYTGLPRKKLKEALDNLLKDPAKKEDLFLASQELLLLGAKNSDVETDFLGFFKSHPTIFKELGDRDLLRLSAERGSLNILKAFIALGCDINQPSQSGVLAIQSAMVSQRFQVVYHLVSEPNFNPNITPPQGRSILQTAFDVQIPTFICSLLSHPNFVLPSPKPQTQNPDINRYLDALEALQGPVPTEHYNSFFSCLELGRSNDIERLLETAPLLARANLAAQQPDGSFVVRQQPLSTCITQYQSACEEEISFLKKQHLKCLRSLLRRYPLGAKQVFKDACKQGLIPFVEVVVQEGELSEADFEHLPPLSPALQKAIEMARLLRDPSRLLRQEEEARLDLVVQENLLASEVPMRVFEDSRTTLENRENSERERIGLTEDSLRQKLQGIAQKDRQEKQALLDQRDRERRILENNQRQLLNKIELLATRVAQEPSARLLLATEEATTFKKLVHTNQAEQQRIEKEAQLKRLRQELEARKKREFEEARLNELAQQSLSEVQATEADLWSEFVQGFRPFEVIKPLIQNHNPLGASLACGKSATQTLLLNEDSTPRAWTKGMLTSPNGIAAIQQVITSKNVSLLKSILSIMEKLVLNPSQLLQFAKSQFNNPKKGSDEFRVLKALQESSDNYLAQLPRLEEAARAEIVRQEERALIEATARETAEGLFRGYLEDMQPFTQMSEFFQNPPDDFAEHLITREGTGLPWLACFAGNHGYLDELYRTGTVDPYERIVGYRPLSIAIFQNNPQLVEVILLDDNNQPRPEARHLLTTFCAYDPRENSPEYTEACLPTFYAVKYRSIDALIQLKRAMGKLGLKPKRGLWEYASVIYGQTPNEVELEIIQFIESWLGDDLNSKPES